MPSLYFRCGTVGSGKSAVLCMEAHQYIRSRTDEATGIDGRRSIYVMKPSVDTRTENVHSRTGLTLEPDAVISPIDDIPYAEIVHRTGSDKVECVFVDEVNFFEPRHIEQLAELAKRVPVICYGIRTDFQRKLFPSIVTLMALMHKLTWIKSVCTRCESKGMYNMRVIDGEPVYEGPQVMVGREETYEVVCDKCYPFCYDGCVADPFAQAPGTNGPGPQDMDVATN